MLVKNSNEIGRKCGSFPGRNQCRIPLHVIISTTVIMIWQTLTETRSYNKETHWSFLWEQLLCVGLYYRTGLYPNHAPAFIKVLCLPRRFVLRQGTNFSQNILSITSHRWHIWISTILFYLYWANFLNSRLFGSFDQIKKSLNEGSGTGLHKIRDSQLSLTKHRKVPSVIKKFSTFENNKRHIFDSIECKWEPVKQRKGAFNSFRLKSKGNLNPSKTSNVWNWYLN